MEKKIVKDEKVIFRRSLLVHGGSVARASERWSFGGRRADGRKTKLGVRKRVRCSARMLRRVISM